MNVEELLKEYKEHIIVNEGNDYAIVGIPFFHLGHDEGIAFRLNYKDGILTISDCHSTIDYLDANGIDLEDYPDKLVKIMKRFDIYLDGNVFRKVIHNYDNPPDLRRNIGYFFEATCLIAHIDM